MTPLLFTGCEQISWPPALATPAVSAETGYQWYDVVSVIDGDTFRIEADDELIRVRLIGVDTPESANPDSSLNTEEGRIASAYTKGLLDGQRVRLEFDVSREDKYGRYLAYVYLESGEMVNELLLKNGYARVMTVPPDVKYANHFVALQQQARASGAGFWADVWSEDTNA